MAGFQGMDPVVLRGIAERMRTQAAQLDDVLSTVQRNVDEAITLWDGDDAHGFNGWWTSHYRPALNAAHQSLVGAAAAIERNVHEQERASGVGGGGGGNGGSDAGGAGTGSSPWALLGMTEQGFRAMMNQLQTGIPWLVDVDPWTLAADGFTVLDLINKEVPKVGNVMDAMDLGSKLLDAFHGDAHWYDLTDAAGTILGDIPALQYNPVAMLVGMNLHVWSYAAEQAQHSDWSASAINDTMSYAGSHPGEVVEAFGEATLQVGAQLVGWIPTPW